MLYTIVCADKYVYIYIHTGVCVFNHPGVDRISYVQNLRFGEES